MKFLDYELYDWKLYGESNWWRSVEPNLAEIGIRYNGTRKRPNKWIVEINNHNLRKELPAKLHGATYDNVEQAKQEIDQWLIRIHNLKSFL